MDLDSRGHRMNLPTAPIQQPSPHFRSLLVFAPRSVAVSARKVSRCSGKEVSAAYSADGYACSWRPGVPVRCCDRALFVVRGGRVGPYRLRARFAAKRSALRATVGLARTSRAGRFSAHLRSTRRMPRVALRACLSVSLSSHPTSAISGKDMLDMKYESCGVSRCRVVRLERARHA